MRKHTPKEAPNPVDIHIGKRIRARRKALNLSKSEIGNILGVGSQQIEKYENGSGRVSALNLFKLVEELNVNIGYFFEDVSAGNLAVSYEEGLGNAKIGTVAKYAANGKSKG